MCENILNNLNDKKKLLLHSFVDLVVVM
jgi:hypothetical protein